MQCDYKIANILRNGSTTSCLVRFYKGAVTTENELTADKTVKPVTRYRRVERMSEEFFEFEGDLTHDELEKHLKQKLRALGKKEKIDPADFQKLPAEADAKDI